MSKKCYMMIWENCAGLKASSFLCADTVTLVSGGCGVQWVLDGINQGFSQKTTSFQIVSSANPADAPADYPYYAPNPTNCNNCQPVQIPSSQPYDCLNGGCVPKTTYNTPGVFASLAACQSGCAKNSNCTGECIPTADITALQAATTNLISRYCK